MQCGTSRKFFFFRMKIGSGGNCVLQTFRPSMPRRIPTKSTATIAISQPCRYDGLKRTRSNFYYSISCRMLHVIFLVLKFVEDCIEWLETMHVVGRKWAYFSTLIEIHPVSVTCSLFDSFLFFITQFVLPKMFV